MGEGQRGEVGPGERAGYEGTPAETLAIWEADAERWPSASSPWRPSAGDIAVYRRLAGSRSSGDVLVLGVTPELRDLVAEAGGKATVVDMSPAMYAAATRLLARADPGEETWIEADWCSPAVPTGGFDLVLGDMIWWGLSVRNQHALRDRIHAALRPAGLVVGRVRIADVTRASQDPAPVVAGYLEQLARAPEEERTIRGSMLSWIYDHTANRGAKRLDRSRARALVLELAARSEFSSHEDFLRRCAALLSGPDWTSQSRDELLGVVCKRFTVEAEGRGGDYDSSCYPVVAFSHS
jgi:SAM-dependent methyltransferase